MLLCLSQLVINVGFIQQEKVQACMKKAICCHSEKQQAATRDNENLKGKFHWEVLPVKWCGSPKEIKEWEI